MTTKREGWYSEHAESYEAAAADWDAGYGPQSRIVFGLLSVGARLAALTEEIRRGRE